MNLRQYGRLSLEKRVAFPPKRDRHKGQVAAIEPGGGRRAEAVSRDGLAEL